VNIVADRLSLALDPVRFARRIGFDPDPWQADLLRSDTRQTILNCSRQSGKSTTTAVLATHEAEYRAESLILLLSPSLRQSQELFRKVRDARLALGEDAVTVAEESALRIELTNGSRIVCLPGKEATIRGYSGVRLLVVDEASRVPDDLYQAVRPMLAVSGGRLILLSTPFGERGFFHHEWTEGGATWQRVQVKAADCPRIPAEWLEAERAVIGQWWYAQEYECQFVATLDQVFGYELVTDAVNSDIEPIFGGWRCSTDLA
jgi:Terminase large subunit, T4likevirus-type, N-terminal